MSLSKEILEDYNKRYSHRNSLTVNPSVRKAKCIICKQGYHTRFIPSDKWSKCDCCGFSGMSIEPK